MIKMKFKIITTDKDKDKHEEKVNEFLFTVMEPTVENQQTILMSGRKAITQYTAFILYKGVNNE